MRWGVVGLWQGGHGTPVMQRQGRLRQEECKFQPSLASEKLHEIMSQNRKFRKD